MHFPPKDLRPTVNPSSYIPDIFSLFSYNIKHTRAPLFSPFYPSCFSVQNIVYPGNRQNFISVADKVIYFLIIDG